jgi:hypothetical protein
MNGSLNSSVGIVMDSSDEYRHELTKDHRRMTDFQIATSLPEGSGLSVAQFHPYWDLVLICIDGRPNYIVTDSSYRPNGKPLKVYGPVATRADAITWTRNTAKFWRETHLMIPEWPWECQ